MKNRISNILVIVAVALLIHATLLLSGCEPLRLAPTEDQKIVAETTNQIAEQISTEGTEPHSPESQKLIQGTRTSLAYIGRAKVPPDMEQFESSLPAAKQQSLERPDPWDVADHALELGIGICALLGGAYGLKGLQVLKIARSKSTALKEIVAGIEEFKRGSDNSEPKKLGDALDKTESPQTKTIVSQLKNGTDL